MKREKMTLPTWLLTIFIVVATSTTLNAQVTGEEAEMPTESDGGSTIFFEPARPLFDAEVEKEFTSAWGAEIIFSGSGFGFGFFNRRQISKTWFILYHLGLSGARDSDEIEDFDWRTGVWFVRGKVNRLYSFPLTVGLQKNLFSESLSMGFEPFLQAGAGVSLITATPYNPFNFFEGWGNPQFFGRFASYFGIGANFGGTERGLLGVNLRYYHVPFGGEGLESLIGRPISNFGGIFLSMHFGFKN